MACSCKAGKKVLFRDPLADVVQATVPIPVLQKSDSLSLSVVVENTKDYSLQTIDTSSTTKPDELCFNCVRKHLGLAYKFVQMKGQSRHFSAVGELMCASNHLQKTHPNLSYKIQDAALYVLRHETKSSLVYIGKLIEELQIDPVQDIAQYIPLYIWEDQEQLLLLAFIYSLLFIQLTYQEVNKTWVTANLSFHAYSRYRLHQDMRLVYQYRPLWKLIQSMQPFDDTYKAARTYLQQLAFPYFAVYKGRLETRWEELQKQEAQRDVLQNKTNK